NRVATSVKTGSSAENLTFSYDRYGNMTCVVNGNTNGPCPSYTFNTSTNRIINANFTYDAAGNLTQDGTGTGTYIYAWNAEGRLKTSTPNGGTATTYTYNALGQRVEWVTGTTYRECVFDPAGVEVHRSDRSASFLWGYVFLGSKRFGKYQDNNT